MGLVCLLSERAWRQRHGLRSPIFQREKGIPLILLILFYFFFVNLHRGGFDPAYGQPGSHRSSPSIPQLKLRMGQCGRNPGEPEVTRTPPVAPIPSFLFFLCLQTPRGSTYPRFPPIIPLGVPRKHGKSKPCTQRALEQPSLPAFQGK